MHQQTIIIDGRTSWPTTLPVLDEFGAAYDLTGATLAMTVKQRNDRRGDDDNAVLTLTLGAGLTVASPATGVVSIEITDEQTALIDPGTYLYDVRVEKSGRRFVPIGGHMVINRAVGVG